jgi:predicted dinucleotide-binding enzyme
MDSEVLRAADIVFLAIPSVAVVSYIQSVSHQLKPDAILINLAKRVWK